MIITTSNINEAKKQINKSTSHQVIVIAHDLEFNRKILEYGKFQIFLGFDKSLNHVMVKIAAKNKITISLDLEKLLKLGKEEKALSISRIIQNIKFCRKAKCKIGLFNYKNKKDAFEFLISLGASTIQAKEATENL